MYVCMDNFSSSCPSSLLYILYSLKQIHRKRGAARTAAALSGVPKVRDKMLKLLPPHFLSGCVEQRRRNMQKHETFNYVNWCNLLLLKYFHGTFWTPGSHDLIGESVRGKSLATGTTLSRLRETGSY